jgi:hypothetical protein
MSRKILIAMLAVALMAVTGCGPELDGEFDAIGTLELEAKRASGSTTTTTTTTTATTKSGSKKGGGTTATAPAYLLLTTDDRASAGAPIWKTTYPLASTWMIHLGTEIIGALPGHHTATVYVTAPSGQAYTRFDLAFATDAPAADGEQQAELIPNGYRVWASMPVSGTIITSYSLFGEWTASVHVDNAATPSSVTRFVLD